MGFAFSVRGVAAGVIGTAGLSLLLSGGVLAQGAPDSGGAKTGAPAAGDKLKDIKITLNADQENLIDTLRTLMKSAKLDFIIDDDLKAGTATVHFKDLPFPDALATLVKVSTLPITYELKDGIYHFKHRVDPPVVEKPAEPAGPARPRYQADKVPLGQLSSADALRKLTGPYNSPPPTLFYHSTTPISHGSTTSFGLNGSGLLQSNGVTYNPDGSVSRTGGPPINIFGLLRGLLGGLGR
jgi:hypothetical protein